MALTTGPKFDASLSDEIEKAAAANLQLHVLMKRAMTSHLVVNDHLCAAALRIAQIHASIKSYSEEFESARNEKEASLAYLEAQENMYASACAKLEVFLHSSDPIMDEVN
jgi:hypothetical protein